MSAPEPDRSFAEEFRVEAISLAASTLHRILHATYRTRTLGSSCLQRRAAGEDVRCIYAGWHGNLWHTIGALRHHGVLALVSSHRDGEIIARVLRRMGFRLARGSSTRGGARAMLDMTRVAREATADLAVAIDGPRGPAREVKEGVLYAASRTGLPIVPVGLWVDRAWRTKSWDTHVIGKPLCRAAIVYGAEIHVPGDATRAQLLEVWAPALVRGMDAAEARARAAVEGT
ncbi:MAG TPA: lysophospholipid acyltransferase family protein [Planctomycetota bacterium]|nr:lysophospholipid acyltransferase family protein [Planctomycetota bacterium]